MNNGRPSIWSPLHRTTRRQALRFLGGLGATATLDAISSLLGASPGALAAARMLAAPQTKLRTSPPPWDVTFVDVAAEAGLGRALNVYGGVTTKKYLIEEIGCGVAFFDYDHDGWLDIFFVNGTTFEGFPVGQEPTNRLFHNNRDGTFKDVTEKAGLVRSGWGQGVCVGDYDNDGFDDLFVTYWGENVLYHNNGDGTFTEVTAKAGLAGTGRRWNSGCCFVDYNRDGNLDLFIANYVNFDPAAVPLPGENPYCMSYEIPVGCGPQGLGGGTNMLFRNRGDGTFEDVSEKSGVVNPRGVLEPTSVSANWVPVGSYGLTAVAADFDNDGWPDLYVACDSAPSRLYRNNHDGTFSEIGMLAGCALSEDGVTQAGMGVAVGDYNNDGWLDIVKTNFSGENTNLYRNVGDGTFYEAAFQAGLGINTRYLGWGAGLVDFDNDGWRDIFLANGHVWPEIEGRNLHVTFKQRKVVYRNRRDGRFEDVTARSGEAVTALYSSRGCAFGDFDNDGDMDVVIINMNEAPSLLRNDSASPSHWIKVKCVGTRSNRTAIGARVRVQAGGISQIDEVMSGGSYVSQNDLRLHFGLGEARRVDQLDVRWPTGETETFRDLPVNRLFVIEEGRGIVRSEEFARRK